MGRGGMLGAPLPSGATRMTLVTATVLSSSITSRQTAALTAKHAQHIRLDIIRS